MDKTRNDLITEGDIVRTEIVKRNNKLDLLESKISLLQRTLDNREKDYGQREEDIRLLKIEIKRLRHEKNLLTKGIENMIDLRQEIFNLERDLKHERIRSRALEELIQTPQNIHRWRKLEGTDPTTLELLEQVRLLQKESLEKSQRIKEMKNLKQDREEKDQTTDIIELKMEVSKLKKKLITREDKIKSLSAELKLREAQLSEMKQNTLSRVTGSNSSYRFRQSNKFGRDARFCESAPPNTRGYSKTIEKAYTDVSKKMLGGGYNLTPKNETSSTS